MGLLDIFRISRIKEDNVRLQQSVSELQSKLDSLKFTEQVAAQNELNRLNSEIANNNSVVSQQQEHIISLNTDIEKKEKQLATCNRKIERSKEIYNGIIYSIDTFHNPSSNVSDISSVAQNELEELSPSVILKLHCMDIKSLQKAFRENDKQINKILELYDSRYTTKANKAIYRLMVIALRAELQNILYNLKYEKLDEA